MSHMNSLTSKLPTHSNMDSLTTLPNEITLGILRLLSTEDLTAAFSTCRNLHELVKIVLDLPYGEERRHLSDEDNEVILARDRRNRLQCECCAGIEEFIEKNDGYADTDSCTDTDHCTDTHHCYRESPLRSILFEDNSSLREKLTCLLARIRQMSHQGFAWKEHMAVALTGQGRHREALPYFECLENSEGYQTSFLMFLAKCRFGIPVMKLLKGYRNSQLILGIRVAKRGDHQYIAESIRGYLYGDRGIIPPHTSEKHWARDQPLP